MKKPFKRTIAVLIVCLLSSNFATTQEETGKSNPINGPTVLKLDFPLFNLPYQIDTIITAGYGFFGSYTSLSMDQSLAVTMDVYSSMHFGLRKLYEGLTLNPVWKNAIYYGGTAVGLIAFAYIRRFLWCNKTFDGVECGNEVIERNGTLRSSRRER
jgi:hypothetical protein